MTTRDMLLTVLLGIAASATWSILWRFLEKPLFEPLAESVGRSGKAWLRRWAAKRFVRDEVRRTDSRALAIALAEKISWLSFALASWVVAAIPAAMRAAPTANTPWLDYWFPALMVVVTVQQLIGIRDLYWDIAAPQERAKLQEYLAKSEAPSG
jgi:hypothetical protein